MATLKTGFERTYLVSNVKWDIEDEGLEDGVKLPTELEFTINTETEDEDVTDIIGEYLTMVTDFCHDGFSAKEISNNPNEFEKFGIAKPAKIINFEMFQ